MNLLCTLLTFGACNVSGPSIRQFGNETVRTFLFRNIILPIRLNTLLHIAFSYAFGGLIWFAILAVLMVHSNLLDFPQGNLQETLSYFHWQFQGLFNVSLSNGLCYRNDCIPLSIYGYIFGIAITLYAFLCLIEGVLLPHTRLGTSLKDYLNGNQANNNAKPLLYNAFRRLGLKRTSNEKWPELFDRAFHQLRDKGFQAGREENPGRIEWVLDNPEASKIREELSLTIEPATPSRLLQALALNMLGLTFFILTALLVGSNYLDRVLGL